MPESQTKGYPVANTHAREMHCWRLAGAQSSGCAHACGGALARDRSGLASLGIRGHSHRLGVQVGSAIVLGISLLLVLTTHAGALHYGTIEGGWWWFFLVAIYLEAFLAVCCLLDTKLTRASRGPRAVHMGHACQPCAHCTYWLRTPASGVPYVFTYVPRTVRATSGWASCMAIPAS